MKNRKISKRNLQKNIYNICTVFLKKLATNGTFLNKITKTQGKQKILIYAKGAFKLKGMKKLSFENVDKNVQV